MEEKAHERGYVIRKVRSISCDEVDVDRIMAMGKVDYWYLGDETGTHDIYLELPHALVSVIQNVPKSGGYWTFTVVSGRPEDTRETIADLLKCITEREIKETGDTSITFWAFTGQAPKARGSLIETPVFPEIKENYPAPTRDAVGKIISFTPPYEGGRLILWHGPPGTGKSSAIRALAREWRPWCDIHYIVDPEQFLGNSHYLLEVLFEETHGKVSDQTKANRFYLEGSKRWRLLVIEDADEFMKHDAKQARGQAVSRLLNITDGLIGQGRKFLMLITTNEKISEIHPAVQRSGRCMANVEFPALSLSEAQEWMGDEPVPQLQSYTLADLYEAKRQRHKVTVEAAPTGNTGQYL
jgi:hypothetical protein